MKKFHNFQTESLKKKSKTKKKSQSKSAEANTLKKLSYSFYNQQTISGSKKIMLDLFPIESAQTQYCLTTFAAPKQDKQKLKKVKPGTKTKLRTNNSPCFSNKKISNLKNPKVKNVKGTSEKGLEVIGYESMKSRKIVTPSENNDNSRPKTNGHGASNEAKISKYLSNYLKMMNSSSPRKKC